MNLYTAMVIGTTGSEAAINTETVFNAALDSAQLSPLLFPAFQVRNDTEALQQLGATAPTVIFFKYDDATGKWKSVHRIVSNFSTDNISAQFVRVLNGEFDNVPTIDNFSDGTGIIPNPNTTPGGNVPGFGLFGINLPWWAWLLVGGVIYRTVKK